MVEGMPRNMSWLVPATSMHREQVELLRRKLSQLHRLSKALYYTGSKSDDVPHDFAVAAADDELALYYQADRLIEKKVDAEKGRSENLARTTCHCTEPRGGSPARKTGTHIVSQEDRYARIESVGRICGDKRYSWFIIQAQLYVKTF